MSCRKFLGTRKLKRGVVSWLGKITKSLFIFSFLLDLLYRRECEKVSHHKCRKSQSHNRKSQYHITLMSYDKCGKVVHRPYSSCISSVGKSNGDSIEFSLLIAEQRAVSFILAWSLAFLHLQQKPLCSLLYLRHYCLIPSDLISWLLIHQPYSGPHVSQAWQHSPSNSILQYRSNPPLSLKKSTSLLS